MNRQKLVRVLVVASAVAVAPVMNASGARAQTSDDQRAEVERIVDELERLEEQSDILAEDYVTAIDEQKQLEADVVVAEQRVAEKEAEVTELRGELSEVAVRGFTASGSGTFGPIFSDSTVFTEELQRDELSRLALSAGTATTDELDQAVSELESERDVLDDKRSAATDKAEQVAQAQGATEQRRAEYQQARQEAETKLGQLLKAEEEARAKASYERMLAEKRAAEEQARADAEAAQAAADAEAARQAAAASPADQGNGNSNSGNSGGNGNSGGSSNSGGGNGGATPLQNPAPQTPSAPSTPPPPPASSRGQTAVNAAMGQLGVRYVYATSNPGVSFDCSGLTKYAWGVAGVGLPHQSRQQYASIPHVPQSQAQPGDLIFFYSPISHVSVYLGGGQHVHAPNSGSVVKVASVNWSNVTGVGRPG